MMTKAFLGLLVCVIGTVVYVRMAPFSPERWHVASQDLTGRDTRGPNSYLVVRQIDAPSHEVLGALNTIILKTAGAKRVAGQIEEGLITYQVRTRFFGFPDYITVSLQQDDTGQSTISIFGRARFGKSDLGLNARRIKGWLLAMGSNLQPLASD